MTETAPEHGYACQTCRRPVTHYATPGDRPPAFRHDDPGSTCRGTSASRPIGYTTQHLAVFTTINPHDPHPPQRSVPPWLQSRRSRWDRTPVGKSGVPSWDREFRSTRPEDRDTTGDDWWW